MPAIIGIDTSDRYSQSPVTNTTCVDFWSPRAAGATSNNNPQASATATRCFPTALGGPDNLLSACRRHQVLIVRRRHKRAFLSTAAPSDNFESAVVFLSLRDPDNQLSGPPHVWCHWHPASAEFPA